MSWLFWRVGRSFFTLFLLIAFTFFTLGTSGDPALSKFGPDIDTATLDAFREKWGLNYPLWKQFLIYLDGIWRFDLGISFRTGKPAWDLVSERLPATLALIIPTIFLSVSFGVPLGIYAAMNHGKTLDRLTIIFSVVALAVPSFLLGMIFMFVFSVQLGWLSPSGFVDWRSLIMPVLTMAIAASAIYARFTRSAMVEIMAHPMIDTAKASGLSHGKIQRVHVLPNVLLPLVTITALEFGNMITFAVVVESVFGWPGVGRLLVESVAGRDYSIVQLIILLTGTTMIISNLLADIAYGWIDPRIRDARFAKRTGKRLEVAQ